MEKKSEDGDFASIQSFQPAMIHGVVQRASPVSISQQLLSTLRCPESRQSLAHVESGHETLARVNRRIAAGEVHDRSGQLITQPLSEALLRQDGKLLFPFEDGFPVLLLNRAIETQS